MNSEYITIERQLLKCLIDENKRLKERLQELEQPKKDQQEDKQITIDEYIKTLKKGNNGIQKNI
jgi:DNA-binding response OmpR family regulator